MVNKIKILLLMAICVGCNRNSDCIAENLDNIYFEGFDKINKISIEDLVDKTNNLEYTNSKLVDTGFKEKRLVINDPTTKLFQNGFIIKVDDTIKYKITDIKMGQVYIEKKTLWGTKIYQCTLQEYKINDSLINTYGMIILKK